jgi:hypothetical protein
MAMTPRMERTTGHHQAVRPRTVAVVSSRPDQNVIETVLGALDHDVVLVEPIARAYSRIRHVRPDLVIALMGSDDNEVCQFLSMLTLDRETSHIPVVTYAIPDAEDVADIPNLPHQSVRPMSAAALN